MKSKLQLLNLFALFCTVAIINGCGMNTSKKYSIAPEEYEKLTEKYLHHIANLEWEESFSFLSDDVEYRLPDGDADSRTIITGLDQVKHFWNNYVEKSGNDRASFTNFVHLPVEVNQMDENIGQTGIFNICYFSADLYFGSEVAKVRMNWTFHFNKEKKIDGIYTYYDRTPIIEVARRNFLKDGKTPKASAEDMVVQIIKINSNLSEEELIKTAKERAERFRAIPGLLQKYYIRGNPGQYGGVYIWDSETSLKKYKESDLAATIPQAYKIVGAPDIEISDVLFQLRD